MKDTLCDFCGTKITIVPIEKVRFATEQNERKRAIWQFIEGRTHLTFCRCAESPMSTKMGELSSDGTGRYFYRWVTKHPCKGG